MRELNRLSSLRTQILLAMVGLVVVGMGSLGLLAAQQIATSVFDDYTNALKSSAAALAGALVESFEYTEVTGSVSSTVDRYAAAADVRVTLVDANGKALLDSSGQLPAGDLRQDPEFADNGSLPLTHAQRPDESGDAHTWTAARIAHDGRTVGYVRVGDSTAEPRARIRQQLMVLGGSFLLLVLLAVVLGTWLTNRLTRPLATLRETAHTLARGDLSQRVPLLATDEMRTVGAAFNEMADQVQSMVAEQKAFAGNAAHELRTPITAIRLRTERLLSGTPDAETARAYIAEIDSEATRMGALIDDLTLLSRLDANRLQTGDEAVDVARVAASLVNGLQERAERESITLTMRPATDLRPVQATTNHVQVVLRNLFDNALKYTPAGGTVTCELEQLEEGIKITIADTGQGVSLADLPHVAQRFYRADRAHTRQIDGVGLGLSLVTSLLAIYGGQLEVSSEGVGRGTTVRVIWPHSPPC